MPRKEVFQFRLSKELLNAIKSRNPNISKYIRNLINVNLAQTTDFDITITQETRERLPYVFYAALDSVVDGDTLFLIVDLGFDIKARINVRLSDINTPPIEEKQGLKAKRFVEKELKNCNLAIETLKQRGKYGRYLTKIYYHPKFNDFSQIMKHGKLLNQELLNVGLAKEYQI